MYIQSKYHVWLLLNCILKPVVKRHCSLFNNCIQIVILHVISFLLEILLFQNPYKNTNRNARHHFISLVPWVKTSLQISNITILRNTFRCQLRLNHICKRKIFITLTFEAPQGKVFDFKRRVSHSHLNHIIQPQLYFLLNVEIFILTLNAFNFVKVYNSFPQRFSVI